VLERYGMNESISKADMRGNLSEPYNALAEEYDKRYQSGYLPDLQNDIIFSTLQEVIGKKRTRILDAGGGTGFYSLPLAAQGHEVVILDKSRNMLKVAEEKAKKLGAEAKIRTVVGDMENIKEPSESFDVVVCHLALCHSKDPLKALKEFSRVLRKHGILSLVAENKMFFSVSEAFKGNLAEALRRYKEEHLAVAVSTLGKLRTFERKKLLDLLEQAGFEPVRVLGLRIISDYLNYAFKHPPADLEKLKELESLLSKSLEWNSIGRSHFIIARSERTD
jgi:ubiquinone/menaquinone biosynthesis C-methylase UbiE